MRTATHDPSALRFGIEAEYALVDADGRLADFRTLAWPTAQGVVEALGTATHPALAIGDLAIRRGRWYLEGDERFDDAAHTRAAVASFDDPAIHAGARRGVGDARDVLRGTGWSDLLTPLEVMLATRRTPAHALLDRHRRAGTIPDLDAYRRVGRGTIATTAQDTIATTAQERTGT